MGGGGGERVAIRSETISPDSKYALEQKNRLSTGYVTLFSLSVSVPCQICMALHHSGGSVLGPFTDNFLWTSGTKFIGTEVGILLLLKTITVFVVKIYRHCSLLLPFMIPQDKYHLLF
jgi:hypothetical protein